MKTAVEWLVEQVVSKLGIRIANTQIGIDLIQQAKDMEREEMTRESKVSIKQAFKIFKAGQESTEEGGKSFDQFWKTYGGDK